MQDIVQLAVIFFIVLIVSFFMKILKQPLIIGYIISGIIIGLFFSFNYDFFSLSLFAQFGIAFLLFSIGLGLNPKIVREVGKVSIITGIGQIVFTSLFGFLICILMGFSVISSFYISVALTFSSTIIIMKLLSDKNALEKLYGRISLGFLLVQDLVAIIILIFVSSLSGFSQTYTFLINIFLKGLLVFSFLFLFGKYVISKFESFFSSSQEFLFIFSIIFGLGVAAIFSYIGLGIEIGALVAGIVLSSASFSYDISSKLKPLRDFFLISFFVLLGINIQIENLSGLFIPVVIFSLFILIGNPLIVIILMGLLGYTKKTSFLAGLTVAQISEFSLILISMGVNVGHLSLEKIGNSFIHIPSLVTLVGLVTIAGSTYMIMYSEKLYKFFEKPLSIFERKKLREKEKLVNRQYDYFLFGENRVGFSIMKLFLNKYKNYVIVDFNPARVDKLKSKGVNCIYGDVSCSTFLEELKVEKAKLVVSTVPELETNLMLCKKIREKNKNSILIVVCSRASEVNLLYKAGADYVLVPNIVSGENLSEMIDRFGLDKKKYKKEAELQIKNIKERIFY